MISEYFLLLASATNFDLYMSLLQTIENLLFWILLTNWHGILHCPIIKHFLHVLSSLISNFSAMLATAKAWLPAEATIIPCFISLEFKVKILLTAPLILKDFVIWICQ